MFDLTPVGPGQTVDDALYERDRAALAAAKAVVQEQAEDDGLWFRAELITEEKLQIALRRLHAVIEGEGMMDDKDARIAELESALAATKKRADNEQWWVTHYSLESGRYLDALRRIAVTNDSDCGLDANAMTLIARAAIAKEGDR